MTYQAYRRVNALLNQHLSEVIDPSLAIRVHYWGFMPEHYNNSLHRHSFFEICYVLDGVGTYVDQEQVYPLQRGTLFCSRPGIWHQIRSETGLVLFFVAFEMDELRTNDAYIRQFRRMMSSSKITAHPQDASITGQIWQTIFQLIQPTKPVSRNLLQALSVSLFLSFLHGLSPELTREIDGIMEDGEEQRHLKRAKLYIEDNLSSLIRIEQIAEELSISPRHLSRIFHAHLGQTVVHYVQERRIQMAKGLLLNTDLAIKDIAKRAGFDSVHYFTRVFTKLLGVSPARFRRSQFSEGRTLVK